MWTQTVDGFTVSARIEADDYNNAPWENDCGHGPVTGWERREKRAGERVLCSDGFSKRFYDFAGAVRIARRDGWGCAGGRLPGETARAYAARAAEADFQRLRAWCNDEWRYVGVVLSVSRNGVLLERLAASLWGIESDAEDHLAKIAEELLPEAIERGREVLTALLR